MTQPTSKQRDEKIPSTLWEVLESTCTTQQIRTLLQIAKAQAPDAVKVGGATKAEVVKAVQQLVADRRISEQQVADIIRDHEESGNQHIFFFSPANESERKRFSDGETIGKSILGDELGSMPSYRTVPKEYTWADFRFDEKHWTAKIYGHQIRIKFERVEEKPHSVIRFYKKLERRVVCLARWDGQHLQMRVSRIGAGAGSAVTNQRDESEVDRRLKKLWELLKGEVAEKHVCAVDLRKPQQKLLLALRKEQEKDVRPKDSKIPFRAVSAQFRDSGSGIAEFHSHDEEEGLSSVNDRKQAIDIFLNSTDNPCRKVVLSWNPDSASGMWGEKWLRTVLGGRRENELIIASGVNARTVDYVTNWIRKFGS